MTRRYIRLSSICLVLLLSLTAIFYQSCEIFQGKIESYEKESVLISTYVNQSGVDPALVFDYDASSPEVHVNRSWDQAIFSPFGTVTLNYFNFRITDALGPYKIEGTVTEENAGGYYIQDFDNVATVGYATALGVIIVFDVSSSLSAEFPTLQSTAIRFFDSLYNARVGLNTYMGVVAFSEGISVSPISNDTAVMGFYIRNLTTSGGSRLYEAINAALNLLDAMVADAKTVVIFTDGRNNAYSDPKFADFNYLADRINPPGVDSVATSTFIIGLTSKGGVDEVALEAIRSRDGLTFYPSDTTTLKFDFLTAQLAVQHSYVMSYKRSSSPTQGVPLKFRFRSKLL